MSFDNHPRLMLVVAMLCVIIAWFGAMRLMAFVGVPQEIIIVTAPISSVVVALIFLYLGRNKLRGAKEPEASFMQKLESPIVVGGMQPPEPVITAEIGGDDAEQSTLMAAEMPTTEPEPSPVITAENPAPEVEVSSPMVEFEKPVPEQEIVTQVPAAEIPTAEPEAPVEPMLKEKLVAELEVLNSVTSSEMTIAHPTTKIPMVADEIPTSVKKVMNEIQKRIELRCIVITAPSHGVLQDRLNNWLSGSYGRVVSTSMAMNDKGFFLTVFYEPYSPE